ncbi:GNAT family N-acetyltransferase [Tenacibaculum sp.]|uniref:GNAT family N-acetyltransferase n=1 Tax=Tenacibaculum sp. TaxID=1906242 RepID=UPI003D0FDC7D
MISVENLELKKLNQDGVNTLVDWAKNEGWNPGKNDSTVFWKTDPDGFYGFYNDKELIAGGAVVSYNQEFGFMGLFIVRPDLREQGIGKKLWYLRRDLLIKRLDKNASIGMDGVVAMQPFYEKGGFNIAFRDERYECIGKKMDVSPNISPIKTEDLEKLFEYDIACFGYKRQEFLKSWFSMPQSNTFKYSENNEVLGYAVIRKVDKGYKIGPLFANNNQIAEELYKSCLNTASGDSVYLDIPTINTKAVDLVNKYDAKYVFECARMYYGQAPKVAIDKIYGITTFELG